MQRDGDAEGSSGRSGGNAPPGPDRRRLLAGIAAGVLGTIAGCTGADGPGSATTADPSNEAAGGSTGGGTAETDGVTTAGRAGTRTGTPGVATPNYGDLDLPVPQSDLHRGAPEDGIPAITRPAFGADWSAVEHSLADGDRVIGVERDGEARAYPLAILNWHEIANDGFGGPLLVSYCPLCGSGVTAKRVVDGEPTTFGVSGYLYQSDLVMYDETTESLWSQIVATAIRGPKTGTRLELVPSTLTTWGAWRGDHPDTRVLLPPPESGTIVDSRPRDYSRNPYSGYSESSRVGIGYNDVEDDRLHPKTQVVGIATGSASKASPFPAVKEAGVVNDTVGDLPVVVAAGPEGTLSAYVRRVDGETVIFEAGPEGRMVGADTEWTITTGEGVSGAYEGWRLDQATGATTMFWFAWVEFNPETAVYGQEEG